MPSSVVIAAATIFDAIKRLFKFDDATKMASVELWVVATVLLLVVRFLIDTSGAKAYSIRSMAATSQIIALLNYNMVHYTMGLMQLSALRVNDYFQVWAVLLVTLQYSVKVGRPYIRSKEIPLLDLMSSFWAANLLRVQTVLVLKTPLWLIWTLNATRMVSYFFSSDKANDSNQENTRLVSDYMRYEHTLSTNVDVFAMVGYKYLVHGEDIHFREVLQQEKGAGTAKYRVLLDPQNEKLVTIEKIWNVDGGKSGLLGRPGEESKDADPGNRLKDVCLSFALYKLLRRRFYHLPMPELRTPGALEKSRRLVFEYILDDKDSYERAFRITQAELSFLRDSFYSRHAATFADGFPLFRIFLSLSLIVATGYVAYPIRHIPERIDPEDKNQITHGVLVTRFIIGLIVGKELWEIYIYAFALWTKVRMMSMYVEHQWLRRPAMEKAIRLLFCLINRGKWNHQICQNNLLILSTRRLIVNTKKSCTIKLKAEVRKAIFDSFTMLKEDQNKLECYLSNAFGSNQLLSDKLLALTDKLEADTHRILVWHIATCLCEIYLSDQDTAKNLKVSSLKSRPYIKEKRVPGYVWRHYITAVSLSNYCAYLVTKGLVPDNGLVANRVLEEVRRETRNALLSTPRSKILQDIYDKLAKIVRNPVQDLGKVPEETFDDGNQGDNAIAAQIATEGMIQNELNEAPEGENKGFDFKVDKEPHQEEPQRGPMGDVGFDNTIIKMGSELGIQLIEAYKDNGPLDLVGLWRDLAMFWTGFLLHLAASTRAGKHKMHLAANGELITHLWALMSHAGFLGTIRHGDQILDPNDLLDDNPLD